MRKFRHSLLYVLTYVAIFIIMIILLAILAFLVKNGASEVDRQFLTSNYNEEWYYIELSGDEINSLDFSIDEDGNITIIGGVPDTTYDASNGQTIQLQEGDQVIAVNGIEVDKLTTADVAAINAAPLNQVEISVPGGGIFPMIIATLYTVVISMAIAIPLGIATAIYLVEYNSRQSKFNQVIHYTIDNLAGIPSIIFGLFGMVLFVGLFQMGYSIIAGSLTLAIMLLPIMIRTTEEALLSVDGHLKEASLGLGATKIDTIFKVILPCAVSGILVGVILGMGRVIGESAILLFTAGTVTKLPSSIHDSAATLTVQTYMDVKEYGDVAGAAATGLVIVGVIIVLNIIAKLIARRFEYK